MKATWNRRFLLPTLLITVHERFLFIFVNWFTQFLCRTTCKLGQTNTSKGTWKEKRNLIYRKITSIVIFRVLTLSTIVRHVFDNYTFVTTICQQSSSRSFTLPYVNAFIYRIGLTRSSRFNANKLLVNKTLVIPTNKKILGNEKFKLVDTFQFKNIEIDYLLVLM